MDGCFVFAFTDQRATFRAMPFPVRNFAPRHGIAELYGQPLTTLSAQKIRELASAPFKSQPCPFRQGPCNKPGGVCSLRTYRNEDGKGIPNTEEIVTVCPNRFLQNGTIFSWAGTEIIGCATPSVIREVPFLLGTLNLPDQDPDAVGQIDMVLVDPSAPTLSWCALEIQAVYFSGPGMPSQFKVLQEWTGPGLPFPDKVRRPDFRSSGPKRLMPQLQTKVPTLRRWGKKMAVIVDLPFWRSLGTMDNVQHISNSDVAWFVVHYEWKDNLFVLTPHQLHLTTLERAVEGLTGGVPVSLQTFESAIQKRLVH